MCHKSVGKMFQVLQKSSGRSKNSEGRAKMAILGVMKKALPVFFKKPKMGVKGNVNIC